MTIYFKTAAAVLVSLVLYLVLLRQNKDISVLFSIAVCCMVAVVAFTYFSQVLDFLKDLQVVGDLDAELTVILLRSVGIGLLGELIGVLCTDAGNATMGKVFQLLSVVMVLWVSLPVLRSVFELIEDVLTAI